MFCTFKIWIIYYEFRSLWFEFAGELFSWLFCSYCE
nr:MAG TPA: hypothetical protein [Caudoviricetes sp.]